MEKPIGADSEKKKSFVVFDSVQKTYDGETLVVKNFNLDMDQGEFITLLGPSGSGKTTCLMMMAGFEVPTHGQILLDGTPITRLPPHKRGIGMVFQNYALFPHMTVAENLAFPLQVRNIPKSTVEEKVKRALAMVKLESFGDRRPAQLSGGQQQRVAVARSLVFEPALVLMDEPLGALDKNLREEMQFEIKYLHEDLGISMIYVTHDQTEALTMSDRIAVFDDGIVQQLATPEALYESPENAFVASFIGENNAFVGEVLELTDEQADVRLPTGEVVHSLPVNVAGKGKQSTLSLRPERVCINPEPGSVPNILDAKVREVIYMGDHLRTRFEVAGNNEFIVKTPNSSAVHRYTAGDKITVGWTVSDCRALDA